MNLFELIKENVNRSSEIDANTIEDITCFENGLSSIDFQIAQEYSMQFANHVFEMILRIQKNECSDIEIDESAFELPVGNKQKAADLLQPLFQKYQILNKESEVYLMAIYLTLADSRKGGTENE